MPHAVVTVGGRAKRATYEYANPPQSLKGTHAVITVGDLAPASYLRIKKYSYKASKMPHEVVTVGGRAKRATYGHTKKSPFFRINSLKTKKPRRT